MTPLDKRLLFVTGKGGVGKTTVAAALGLVAARNGKRAIVCEVQRQERMSRAFRREGVGMTESEIAPGLSAISIDPETALVEYLEDQVHSATVANLLFKNRIFHNLAEATPGMRELVTIGKIWELAQLERRQSKLAPYDLVIVDAPATGHGLGLLRTPSTFRRAVRVGPIARQAGRIEEFVSDKALTGVVVVALPEEMPVTETLEFRELLRKEMSMKPDAMVVNALLPERFTSADAERLAGANGDHPVPAVRDALRAALGEHRRARVQRSHLRRLRRESDEPVVTLPFLFQQELELDDFERLSNELERRL